MVSLISEDLIEHFPAFAGGGGGRICYLEKASSLPVSGPSSGQECLSFLEAGLGQSSLSCSRALGECFHILLFP